MFSNAFDAERQAHERTLEEMSRSLLQVVDSDLARRATVAQVLAHSRSLDDGAGLDATALLEFDGEARRVMRGMGGWVELHAPGRVLLNTRLPPDQTPVEAENINAPPTLATVLPLQAGDPEQAHTALLEPAHRQGTTVLNLRVTMRPAELPPIIDRQRLQAQWVATVLDDRGRVVARHPGGANQVGRSATADMQARLAAGQTGSFESVTLDGMRSAGFMVMGTGGWSVITAMPREQFAGVLPPKLLPLALGGLVLLATAVAAALWLARRIAGPVEDLKLAAGHLKATWH